MSHTLLDEYARLLTTDTRACANLFASDAEFSTHVGSHRLTFKGREDIGRFLRHVPCQIAFRAAHCVADAGGFSGSLRLSAADLRPRQQRVRYFVEGGRITRFEVLHGHLAPESRAS
ncbi:MAG: ketosteroid isomerase family protein [Planctomycetota bacterium]|nr:ketosteroid isomerase family protein [Planctomycetota bacterium]